MNALQSISALFGKFLEATLSASVLAAVVFLLQLALRKRLSAGWRFALSIPVLIRLLIPVLPESSFSIFNAPRWFRTLAPSQPQVIVEIRKSAPALSILPQSVELPPAEQPSLYVPELKNPGLTTIEKLAVLWLGVAGFLLLRLGIGTL